MAFVVFDIGGTAVKYGKWEQDALSAKGNFPTPKTWQELKERMNKVFDQLSILASKKITGVAISSPGAVDSEKGIIGGFSAVSYIHHFPIREELQQEFGVPVTIENDANCAALAEVWQGAASDVDNALFVVIGSGIGGAVIMNRQLMKGKNLFGGEFGYMLLEEDLTFSDLASPVRVAQRYCAEMGNYEVISGRDLFERAENGDILAAKYVEGLKRGLARGIQNLLVAFNPDKVVIGGAISARTDLLEEVQELVHGYLERTKAMDVVASIVPCQFHNDANLIGAVAAFQTQTESVKDNE